MSWSNELNLNDEFNQLMKMNLIGENDFK
ncbi:hypothetical protein PBAL39_06236 [Pedobacter sp. BAL39]|nr:hypothetical protein PBAL39_06236 [Pedobacter sp. BAL39]